MSDTKEPDEHLKEQVAKFRYNWQKFNKIMDEYERTIEMSIKGRNNARTDLINGMPSKKWDKFIQDQESASIDKINEAIETFQLLKSLLTPETQKHSEVTVIDTPLTTEVASIVVNAPTKSFATKKRTSRRKKPKKRTR